MKKNQPQLILNLHTIFALAITLLIYFIIDEKKLCQEFFLSSLVFNLYLRLLQFGFNFLLVKSFPNALLSFISACRVAIVAAILAIFIIKFNFNVWVVGVAFAVYNVILLIGGVLFNNHASFRN